MQEMRGAGLITNFGFVRMEEWTNVNTSLPKNISVRRSVF
jgi:hypothetical protein